MSKAASGHGGRTHDADTDGICEAHNAAVAAGVQAEKDALKRAKRRLDGIDLKAAWCVLCTMEDETTDVFGRAGILDMVIDHGNADALVLVGSDLVDAITNLHRIYTAMQQVVSEAKQKEAA